VEFKHPSYHKKTKTCAIIYYNFIHIYGVRSLPQHPTCQARRGYFQIITLSNDQLLISTKNGNFFLILVSTFDFRSHHFLVLVMSPKLLDIISGFIHSFSFFSLFFVSSPSLLFHSFSFLSPVFQARKCLKEVFLIQHDKLLG